MANITVAFGAALILLGVGAFVLTGATMDHITALIPAFFGLPLGLLGIVARKDHLRKHAMHAAVLLGLVGFVGRGCDGGAFRTYPDERGQSHQEEKRWHGTRRNQGGNRSVNDGGNLRRLHRSLREVVHRCPAGA